MQSALQAAGHEGCSQGEGLYVKPTTQQEIDFYQNALLNPSELDEFLPEFMGTLQQDSTNPLNPETSENSENVEQPKEKLLLVMEDICGTFSKPNILDVKMGKVLFDDKASPDKQERLRKVAQDTTSGKLGFRIAGATFMKNNERVTYGKMYGREATVDNISDKLAAFWPNAKDDEYVLLVWESVISRIKELREALSTQNLELRSASVLVVYEGDLPLLKHKVENQSEDNVPVDVRLIDFAHTKVADKPDTDVLEGLDELVRCLSEGFEKYNH